MSDTKVPDLSGLGTLATDDEIYIVDVSDTTDSTDGTSKKYTVGIASGFVGQTDSQTLTNKTLTSPVLNTGVSGTAILDEDDMATDSNTQVPTQQSVKAYVDTHAADTTTHGATGAVVGTTNSQTLTSKTLTSPVLNTSVSGTAVLDEDTMTSDSDTQLATQQSIKAYVDAVDVLPDTAIQFVIDGGGFVLTTGVKLDLEIPFDCTINGVTALADQSGSVVVDLWVDTYANYPPTNDDSITASAPVTISTATKSQDNTLTGWTTSLTEGKTLRVNVDSCTTITRVTVSLDVTKV